MVVTIDELITRPFSSRTHEEKVRILAEGKPESPSGLYLIEDKLSGNTRGFALTVRDADMHNQIAWLIACNTRGSVFCWPCLLFSQENEPWFTEEGYRDLSRLTDIVKVHEKSLQHIQSALDLLTFYRQNMPQYSFNTNQANDMVLRNRDIMKRIIDVVCHLIARQRPPREGSIVKNELKCNDCLEALELLRSYDNEGVNIIDDAMNFLQTSPNILPDLVDAMTIVLKSSIQNEIKSSTFVSLILSGHAFDGVKRQISSVLRYPKYGKVCERFVGFTTLDGSRSDGNVLNHIRNVTAEYEISSKLIAVSCDGAVLPDKNAIDFFLRELSVCYSNVIFAPSYLHKFDEVLLQSLTLCNDCDLFFKTTRAIGTFLFRDRQNFENFIHNKAPKLTSKRLDFTNISVFFNYIKRVDFTNNAVFFSYIKRLRKHLLEYFDYVLSTGGLWKAQDLTKVLGFRLFLEEFKTIFLLEMFVKYFSSISDFSSALNSETPETVFESNRIDKVVAFLENEKESGFDNLWKSVINSEIEESRRAVVESDKSAYDICRMLFNNATSSMLVQIFKRFKFSTQLEHLYFWNPTKYKKCIRTLNLLSQLKELCGNTFDVPQMRNELDAFNANPDLNNKSTLELFEFFVAADLKDDIKNVFKLTELTVTMPFKPPSLNDSSSKLDKIKSWFSGSTESKGDLSVLCVEIDSFLRLKTRYTFYDEVISKFEERN